MVDAKMSIYDYLAAVPMIEGAGDIMSDWQCNPMTLESGVRVLAVTHARLHEQAMRA
jgi:fructose-1,6-bisphosphatase/inositol monophosphatase family enzyme